jgi:ComF family protein
LAVYDGIAKTLIWKLKFERARSAGVEIGMMLAPLAKELANAEAAKKHPANTIVVHVPTATVRVRLRGYDQAAIIAREVAHSAGLRYSPLLARAGRQMQRGASRAQRKEQLQLAFRVRRPHLVKNAHIILVDDVITTGATLEAAAATLKAAGAKKVEAVTFAQA